MTISEATLKLYDWFLKSDSFCENNFIDVTSISETPEADRAAILGALKELEASSILKKISYQYKENKEIDYWILSKKLVLLNQNLEISAQTAFYISEIINNYCETFKIENERCNPSSITEKDIQNVIKIFGEIGEKFFDKTPSSS